MKNTAAAIMTLVDCFERPDLPRAVCEASLEALIRLALTEYACAPVLAMQEDLRKVDEIAQRSKAS